MEARRRPLLTAAPAEPSALAMKKILSIDDEPALLELFRAALSLKGHQVFVAGTVKEGLRILEEQDISLILLDIHMPERDGFDIYRELRQRRQTPVLFVTGDARAFADARGHADFPGEEIGGEQAHLLLKPFDVQTLYDRVDALIGAPESKR